LALRRKSASRGAAAPRDPRGLRSLEWLGRLGGAPGAAVSARLPPGGITPGDFYALVFLRQLISAYRREHAALTQRLRTLEAQLSNAQGVEP
jgi:hypothetical protein